MDQPVTHTHTQSRTTLGESQPQTDKITTAIKYPDAKVKLHKLEQPTFAMCSDEREGLRK